MRVVHICPTHFSATSVLAGAERYSFELTKAMARRTPTTLITFGDKAFTSNEGPLTIRCYQRWTYVQNNRLNPFTPAFFPEILRADVVHCHQYATMVSDLAVVYGKLARKRVFVTDLAGSAARSLWYRLKLWRAVDSFLLISRFNQGLMDRFPGRTDIIYGGVDADRFRLERPAGSGGRVLFVGRLSPHKGIDVLLAALDPDMEAVIIGRADSPEFQAQLDRAAAGKRVVFRPDCPDSELLGEYQRASVVALPALQDSGYTTALEAMSCRIPVIGTSVGSLPELVADGETGFIVPPKDPEALRAKLRTLANDPALAARMGEAGRERVLRLFTWDHVVDRCLKSYAG